MREKLPVPCFYASTLPEWLNGSSLLPHLFNPAAFYATVLATGNLSGVYVRMHDDRTDVTRSISSFGPLWTFNGVASIILIPVALETLFRMRHAIGWPAVAVIFEGIFAASFR